MLRRLISLVFANLRPPEIRHWTGTVMKIKNTTFTPERVVNIYRIFVSKATELYCRKKYNKSIKYVVLAAKWMYYFNNIFFDDIIEKLILAISESIFPKVVEEYKPDNNCVVFLDSICTTKCLGVQYLSALMALNKRIIYIQHTNLTHAKSVIPYLNGYPNIEIYTIDKKISYIESAKKINKIIEQGKPSDIILHMPCYDAVSLIAISNIKSAVKYNIDLQDHTFWLGRSFIDYDIVFRDYGEKVALEKREIKEDQIIRLPYYPLIKQNSKFLGFPSDLPSDAIIIFTGGSPYKMLGKDDIFFKLLDIILDISNKVHILIATDNSDVIKQKITQRKYNDRVHLIGFRKDIDQVFKHSHIYLSTYPFIGGLMTQYAAVCGLPILAYAEKNEPNVVEGLVNHKQKAVKSQRNIDDFKKYAKSLISDSNFRSSEGLINSEAIFSENDFLAGLNKVLDSHQTGLKWQHRESPDYNEIIKFYIENENKNCHSGVITSIMTLHTNVFSVFYKETLTVLQLIIRGSCKRIKEIINEIIKF